MSRRDEPRHPVTKPDEAFVTGQQPVATDPLFQRILAYAKSRWCWDDESMLAELYEREAGDNTVEATVDGWARHYDLIDPRDVGV
jgi:hypothetical protein